MAVVQSPNRPLISQNSQAHGPSELLYRYITFVLAIFLDQTIQVYMAPVFGALNVETCGHWKLYISAVPLHAALLIVVQKYGIFRLYIVNSILPLLAVSAISIVNQTFQVSGTLGPVRGPLLSLSLAKLVLVPATLISLCQGYDRPKHDYKSNGQLHQLRRIFMALLPVLITALLVVLDAALHPYSVRRLASNLIIRLGPGLANLVISAAFLLLSYRGGQWTLSVGIICFAFSLTSTHLNTVRSLAQMNASLSTDDLIILDRAQSITGYISVIESRKESYRALRCDHSLLGGEWLFEPTADYSATYRDPIFAVFVMLEAVRLVVPALQLQSADPAPDATNVINNPDSALFIGLGVGTSPAALIAHGINTTILELDPVVAAFATKYFSIPDKTPITIIDALDFFPVNSTGVPAADQRYKYIIHDVFTGGVEPLALFTQTFLLQLRAHLQPDGVIAINYAGEMNSIVLVSIVQTANSVFPSSCRLFRESAAPQDHGELQDEEVVPDQTNLIMFCIQNPTNTILPQLPFHFRDPVEADFLKTRSRRSHLVPQHEVPLAKYLSLDDAILSEERVRTDMRIRLEQESHARDHWHLMRNIIPSRMWEGF